MRRFGKLGAALAAALVLSGVVAVPAASPAPVSFSPTPIIGWSTNGPVKAVLIVGNTVYAGGDFTTVRPSGGGASVARANLAAFDLTTGALRTGFTADTNGRVEALVSDGNRLYAGGTFTTIKGVNRGRLAAVDLVSGNVITGFAANANSNVFRLALKGDRLYVGGSFSSVANVARGRIAAVNATTGALDPIFNPNADNTVRALAVSPDGNTVYAGGQFDNIGGGARRNVAPLSVTTGELLPLTFQYPLVAGSIPLVIDLDVSPSGDRLFAALGGYENQVASWSTISGRKQWLHQVNGDAQAAHYYNGNVYFGFHEGDLGDDTVRMLVADAATGAVVQPYRLPINSFFGVWNVDTSPQALVLGGEFTNVNGVNTQGVAILPRASQDPVPPTPPSNLRVTATTNSAITLAWNPGADNLGVAGYRVLRDGVEVAFPSGTTYQDIDLPSSTDFTYEVQTMDNAGNFSSSTPPLLAGTDTTLVPLGANWRYLANGVDMGTAWRATTFNDSAWPAGDAQLGYGDGDETTVVPFGPDPNNRYRTTYFRRTVQIDNPANLANVNVTLLRDDGAVIYVNGVEVVRSNMPTGNITYNSYATTNVEGAGETQLWTYQVPPARFVAGTNSIAVEIHQQYRSSSDVSFDFSLSTARLVGPGSPTNLHTTAVTGTSAALAWTAPSGSFTGFRVYRDGVLVGSPTGTTFSDPGLESVRSYTYTVTAVDAANLESTPSAAVVVNTPDIIPPSAPAGLEAGTVTVARAELSWTAATDNVSVTGYDVLRDGAVIGSSATTAFTDHTVAPEETYTYAVRARDAAGNQSTPSAPISVTTPDLSGDVTAPTVPTNLRATSRGSTSLDLAWDASTDDTGVTAYIVARNGVDLPATAATTLTDGLLAPGVTYTYTVRALDAALNDSGPSAGVPVTTHLASEVNIPANSVWKYTDDGVNRGTAWRAFAYDDSSWKSGAGKLGYGDGDETTVMSHGGETGPERWMNHYFRKTVTITDANRVTGMTFSMRFDDGAIVFVNGVEAFRVGMPATPTEIPYNTFATIAQAGAGELTYFDFAIPPSVLREGTNVIAVDLHQNSRSGAVDIGFDARLTTRYGAAPTPPPVDPPDVVPPSTPTGLAAGTVTVARAELAWNAATDNVGVTGYDVLRDGVQIGTSTTPAYTDHTVAQATTYSYTVRARDLAANTSAESDPLAVTTPAPDTNPPSVPQNLRQTAVTSSTASLAWDAATDDTGVTAYVVSRNGVDLPATASTSLTDSPLASGVSYTYTVRARDLAGNTSAESDPLAVTTPAPDTNPPSVPQNLRQTAVTGSTASLAWDAATDDTDVTGYDVLRDGVQIGTSTTPAYTDHTVAQATTYSYTVRARDLAANTSAESDPLAVTTPAPDTNPPSVPQNLRQTAVTSSTASLAWDAATDDTGVTAYVVSRNGVDLPATASTSVTDSLLASGLSYTYTVRAIDASDNSSAASDPLVVTTPDVVAPSTPGNLTAPSVSAASVQLAWNASTDNVGVVAYDVRRDGTLIGSPSTTGFTDGTVVGGQTYSYTVTARDAAGNTAASSPLSVTAVDPSPTLFADLFGGATGSPWGPGWTTGVANGTATQQSGTGRLAMTDVANAYSRAQLTGLAARADSDTTFSYQFNDTSAAAYLNVYTRGSGGWQNAYRPNNGYGIELRPNAGGITVARNSNGITTTLASVANARQVSTAKQWLRLRVVGSTIQFKSWVDGQAQPAAWTATVTDSTVSAPGQLHLSLVRSSTNVGAKHVQIDDLQVMPG